MVLSHHGQLEFGSPKVPIFPEALLLHYLDDMDSKMECMRVLIEKEPQAEGYFTGLQSALDRVALRKSQIPGHRKNRRGRTQSRDIRTAAGENAPARGRIMAKLPGRRCFAGIV